ncbi:MAG: VanW family protein [Patescibacteria group bacterium]
MTAKKPANFKFTFKVSKRLIIVVCVVLLLVLIPIAGFQFYYQDKIYPGISVAGVDLSKLTLQQANTQLKTKASQTADIVVVSTDQEFTIPQDSIDVNYNTENTALKAYKQGRSGNPVFDASQIITALTKKTNLGFNVDLNEQALAKNISVISGVLETETVYPSATLNNDTIVINSGKQGVEIDELKLRLDIGQHLANLDFSKINVDKKNIDPTLSPTQELEFKQRAEKLKGKGLKLTFEFEQFNFTKAKLLALIDPKVKYNTSQIQTITSDIAKKINRDPQNSTFSFEDGKVKEFAPAKSGVVVKTEDLSKLITESLASLEISDQNELTLTIPVETKQPEVQTEDVNNLGIKELIGRGTSLYRGSIPSRVYNIALATSRLNGVLIKPGETFSFNNAIGDISKLSGFQEAYVIQSGKTVLGDGGGVCQVSTTIFRAALNAGLPINERQAHAYRVGYYEQDSGPGLDATIFTPTTDLKFTNNTPGHILIQAKADSKNFTLVFELYGTNDSRVSTVTKPKILSQTAPPPDVYQDDPTLPLGTVKQVEHKAWGAKTVFDYTVTKDGKEIYKKTFTSVYRPWAAVYLRGTAI